MPTLTDFLLFGSMLAVQIIASAIYVRWLMRLDRRAMVETAATLPSVLDPARAREIQPPSPHAVFNRYPYPWPPARLASHAPELWDATKPSAGVERDQMPDTGDDRSDDVEDRAFAARVARYATLALCEWPAAEREAHLRYLTRAAVTDSDLARLLAYYIPAAHRPDCPRRTGGLACQCCPEARN